MLAAVLLAGAAPAAADAAVGFRDFSWMATGVSGPTADKPQSKLWYNDGIWWADMFDVASNGWRIFRLDVGRQTWVNTGTPLDSRPLSWADTLWDGAHLYVASAGPDAANNTDSGRLYRYSYTPATKTYSLDAGFPVTIVKGGMEAIVFDKDSTGRLWATWTRNNQVYVNATTGSDTTWGTPFVLPVNGTTVSPDDISSVLSVNGRIGVMWSNQVDNAMYYSEHADSASPTSWSPSVPVLQGPNTADDHINLKSVQDSSGQLFAAVKTSLGNIAGGDPNAALIVLLKRDAAGNWSKIPVSTVADDQTRPLVMLAPDADRLYLFATTPIGGGTVDSGTALTAVFYKETSMSNPSFGPGPGTPFIQTDGDQHISNATSTKQLISSATGLVVLASDNGSGFYVHNTLTPPSAPPPPPPPPPPPAAKPSSACPCVGQATAAQAAGAATEPVVTTACSGHRSVRVRWALPKGQSIRSIAVTVDGKRVALRRSKRSAVVRFGTAQAVRVVIRAHSRSGRVYTAVRRISRCSATGKKAVRLVRVAKHRRT